MNSSQKMLTALLLQDKWRMHILRQVDQLDLPNCYVAAGFVRNLIWDHLHHFSVSTPLNDIDVIYFSHDEKYVDAMHYELRLKKEMPEVNWQVKNQSNMHQKHGHLPYNTIIDAISFWPEKETAIAVRLLSNNRVEYLSVFGFDFLFDGYISHNVKVPLKVFEQRVKDKQWQKIWPNLKLKYNIDSLVIS